MTISATGSARTGASPPSSLFLSIAGNWSVPHQLLVRPPKGRNHVTILPHGTSVLEVRSAMPDIADIVELEGMRVFRLPAALFGCSARFFSQSTVDTRTALAVIHDAQDMLRRLLAGGHSMVAGRLAGAFRGMGRARMANDIVGAMRAAGFTVRESDPFGARAVNSARAMDVGAEVVGGGSMDVLSPVTFRNGNGTVCQICSTRDSGRNF